MYPLRGKIIKNAASQFIFLAFTYVAKEIPNKDAIKTVNALIKVKLPKSTKKAIIHPKIFDGLLLFFGKVIAKTAVPPNHNTINSTESAPELKRIMAAQIISQTSTPPSHQSGLSFSFFAANSCRFRSCSCNSSSFKRATSEY